MTNDLLSYNFKGIKMKAKFVTFVILLVCICFGCKEKDIIYVNDGPSNIKTGTITGLTSYYSNFNYFPIPGVTVCIEGTTFTTLSDSNGVWALNDVPIGTYNLYFAKAGYDTVSLYGQTFTANGTLILNRIALESITTAVFSDIATNYDISSDKSDTIGEIITTTWADTANETTFNYSLCLSTDANVNFKNYTLLIYCYEDYRFDPTKNKAQYYIQRDTLYHYFKPGEKVYVIAYPGSVNYVLTNNPITGINRYSIIGKPSPVTSFIMP